MIAGARHLCAVVLAAAAICIVMNAGARAVQPDEVLTDTALEQRARSLSAELRCVVCQNQSIDDSDAPLARDLRLLVRERLVAGDTDSQVFDFIVARYGEFVLLRPRFGVHTAFLWLLPFVLLLSAVSWLLIRRRAVAPVAGVETGTAHLSDEEEQALAKVLDARPLPVAKE